MDLGENVFILKNIRIEYISEEEAFSMFEIVNNSWLEISSYLNGTGNVYEDFFLSCDDYLTSRIKVLYIIGSLDLLNGEKLMRSSSN